MSVDEVVSVSYVSRIGVGSLLYDKHQIWRNSVGSFVAFVDKGNFRAFLPTRLDVDN